MSYYNYNIITIYFNQMKKIYLISIISLYFISCNVERSNESNKQSKIENVEHNTLVGTWSYCGEIDSKGTLDTIDISHCAYNHSFTIDEELSVTYKAKKGPNNVKDGKPCEEGLTFWGSVQIHNDTLFDIIISSNEEAGDHMDPLTLNFEMIDSKTIRFTDKSLIFWGSGYQFLEFTSGFRK